MATCCSGRQSAVALTMRAVSERQMGRSMASLASALLLRPPAQARELPWEARGCWVEGGWRSDVFGGHRGAERASGLAALTVDKATGCRMHKYRSRFRYFMAEVGIPTYAYVCTGVSNRHSSLRSIETCGSQGLEEHTSVSLLLGRYSSVVLMLSW